MKKRILSLFLVVCILSVSVSMFPMGASAATSGTCGDNLTWTFDAGTLTISGTGNMYEYSYGSYASWNPTEGNIKTVKIEDGVTSIGDYAFSFCDSLNSITIPDSITSIGNHAFYYCLGLTSAEIPESVTSIGDYAFYGCESIDSITIPDSIASISDGAFGSCSGLTSITIPDSVESIGSCAFELCTSIETITIPDSVTNIGDGAFGGCSNLESITIPDGITCIEYGMFRLCSGLTSITIPNSVTDIENTVFFGCENLTDVYYSGSESDWENISIGSSNDCLTNAEVHYDDRATSTGIFTYTVTGGNAIITGCSSSASGAIVIPSTLGGYSVTSIGEGAFYWCADLTSITIPNSVRTIGDSAFGYCESLTNITIPNSVTSIGSWAFYWCTGLTSPTIGNSVTSIGEHAFDGCRGLTSITIPDSVRTIGDYAFYLCESLNSITIPNSVTSIGKEAFYWCSSLTSVTIGTRVTSIGEFTFCGCSSLNSITIPGSVTSIGDYAFYDCSGLTSVTIGNGVTSIGEFTFCGCSSLNSITIPDSVTSIGYGASASCNNLTYVYYAGSKSDWGKISIGNNNDYLIGSEIHCKDGLLINAPSGACGDNLTWTLDEAGTLTISGTGDIYDWAGNLEIPWNSAKDNIKTVKINHGVTRIGTGTFKSCKNLTSITIPNSVTSIGDSAFSGCSSLNSITIPNSVTKIGKWVFNECYSLDDITIPDSVISIDYGAFMSCSSLEDVTISSNLKYITDALFAMCSSLTRVTIPDSVTSIGMSAFLDCSSLINITIPDSVTDIGDYVFMGCSGLTSITVPDNVTKIGYGMFDGCTGLTSVIIPDSVESIRAHAFNGCDSLKDVYYSGSESAWKNISVYMGNEDLTSATIHYNYVQKPIYVPSQNVNINTNSDPAHMPVNINMVTINGKGTAYGRYKIQKNDGSVAKKQKVYCCVNGGTKTAVYTDDYGYATVEIPGITKSANYNISFSGNGIISCEGILIVTVELLHFKSECEAEVSANLKASVGIDTKEEFGKLQAKAGIGSVGVDGSAKSTLSFAQEYINGKNKLVISSKTNFSAAANGKLGLFAEVKRDKFAGLNIDPLSVSGKAGYENFLGVGFEDEDFSFSDSGDILDVANFLLNVYVTNTQGNIVGKYVANVLNTPINYYETGSSICLEKGGNIGAVELEFGKSEAKGEVTLGGISSKSVWTNSTKTMKDNSREYSSGIVAEGGTKLYDITIGYSKAKSSLGSMKDFISDNLMISATKNKDGELEELTLSSKQEGEDGGFIYSKTETTGKNITYKNEAAQKIVSGNSELKKFASGDKAYFSKDQMKNVIDTMLNSDGSGEFCKTEQVKEAISLDISAGGGALISFGGGYGISGAFSYEYDSESGIYENGTVYIQAKNEIADEVEYYVITIDDIWQQTKSTVNSILEGIMDTVKGLADGVVEFGKAVAQKTKNTVTGWVISITKTSTPVKSMKILAVEDEFALFSTSSLATTIGEPYIISVEDKNGNEVVDFTQNPISLTLSYSEEDLQDANVTDVSNISAVWWDDEKCVYVKQDGLLDEENSCVVLEITKPGQYVLAIDDCAPAITQFEVNGGGELPDVYAVVSDMSGIADFTFSIDGEEVLDKSDFEEYYNHVTGEFAYRAKDLSDGEHTATIYAKDTFGNETEKTIIFNTDNTVPEITNVTAVPEVITEDLIISANVTNAHESGVLLNAEYTDIYGSAQTLTVDMVEKDGKYTASLPEISNGYNVKIWISAFSESGNESESEKQEAIVMKSEDGEPVIAITKIKDESVTLRCFGISSFKDISAHIGVYDENGKLLMVKSLPLAQEVTFSGVTQKGIVKAFLWDKNLSPVVLPVCAQSQKQE